MAGRPDGDVWNIVDNDKDSQHYGRNFKFDFSYISSEEIKDVVKDYVWQNYRVGNKAISTLYKERAEVFQSVGVIGNINQIQSDAFDNVSEFEWFKANKDKCVAGLCDGYCTKPVTDGNICPRLLKRQKCYHS